MNYELQLESFPSGDGKSTVAARIYVPKNEEIKGVLQIAHGMKDHVERYEILAEALTKEGYVVAGNDHIGHGRTAKDKKDLGFFAEEDSINIILHDLHSMNRLLRTRFPEFKPVLLGHSMGSFLSRLYVNKYPHTVSGHIIHGTGGPMGAILPLGKALVNTVMLFKGKRGYSKLIANMAFMGYNSKFPKSEGECAWLTRDVERVNGSDRNEYTTFPFSVSAYRDLFNMVGLSNSKKWFSAYPKELPTLVMSGNMDPVGNYGKGPSYVYKHLVMVGISDVTLRLYDGARHELFNETCREEVFSDITNWLSGVFK